MGFSKILPTRAMVFLVVTSVLYFSYIPFLYLFDLFGISKINIFVILILLVLFLLSLHWIAFGFKIERSPLIVLLMYASFAAYALFNFVFIGRSFGGIFTIRTLTVINVIFIIMALSIRDYKDLAIKVLLVYAFAYVLLSVISLSMGKVSLDSNNFQNIAPMLELEGGYYQNINTYLGLFVILCLYLMEGRRRIVAVIVASAIIYCLFVTFLVGGRGAIVALFFVLWFYMIANFIKRYKSKSHLLKLFLCLCGFALLGLFFWNEIASFLRNSVTFKRFSLLLESGDSSTRMFLFSKAIELFLKNINTFFIGGGVNSFPEYIHSDSEGMYPHNIPLELLSEYGVIGFFLFFLPIAYVLYLRTKVYLTVYGDSLRERIVFLIAMYFWVIHLYSGGLRDSWVLLFFTYLLLPQKGGRYDKKEKKFYPCTGGLIFISPTR